MKKYYFDSCAYTPIDPLSYKSINEVLKKQQDINVGNPISNHKPGENAKNYLEEARNMVAKVLLTKNKNIIFTSGATEANLLIIRTAILKAKRNGIKQKDMHMVIGSEEHSSIYRIAKYFSEFDIKYTIAKPTDERKKIFTPESITKHITKNTILVSLQYINSKNGRINDISSISKKCKEKNPSIFFHTDSAQGSAYFNCSPNSLNVDATVIDSTKTFGPQGVGAAVFNKIEDFSGLSGEFNAWDIRPGTPSIALIYGFAIALMEAKKNRVENTKTLKDLKKHLINTLKENIKDTYVNGLDKNISDVKDKNLKQFASHIIYLSFPDVNHSYLATLLNKFGFYVSTNTACDIQTDGELRVGLLPETKNQDIDLFVKCIQKNIKLSKKI